MNRLATCLAVELMQHKIRVNVISPNWIDVPITKNVYGKPGSPAYEAVTGTMLAGRLGRPEEVVETAVLLASDEVPYMHAAPPQVAPDRDRDRRL